MGARTLGIDVSHYQGDVSWSRVATSEVAFCFIKATEAGGWVDPWFERNWRRAQEAGLFRGAYHFGRVGSDPKANAHHFFSVVGPLGFRDLPPVLDIEDGDGHTPEHIKAWTREFLKEAKRLFDRVPIIYTGSFWRGEMRNPADPDFGEHPLWLAGYVPEGNLKIPAAWQQKKWTFWQYSEGVHNRPKIIPGVKPCDQNLFEGSVSDLDALCANDARVPPPLPDPNLDDSWPGVYLVWNKSPAMHGPVVRAWQTRMKQRNFEIDVDGVYGPQSKRACQALQRNEGLTNDGIVGPKTWAATFAT
jgi:lysozyme